MNLNNENPFYVSLEIKLISVIDFRLPVLRKHISDPFFFVCIRKVESVSKFIYISPIWFLSPQTTGERLTKMGWNYRFKVNNSLTKNWMIANCTRNYAIRMLETSLTCLRSFNGYVFRIFLYITIKRWDYNGIHFILDSMTLDMLT